MNKKLAASLTIAIFLLSTIAILAPVQAHFTLGLNNEGAYPYTVTNFDPHTTGVIGYVWPGGGEDTYDGSPTGSVPNTLKIVGPGYVAPYPLSALAKAGVYPAPWSQNYAQEDGDEYAPFGAIVVGSTGDLIFAINRTGTWAGCPGPTCQYSALWIAIPPEFKVPNTPEQVVTTITNNYANIWTFTANAYDRYVPGWTLIRILADTGTCADGACNGGNNPIHFYAGQDEWYYVRVNGVTAPTIAGRYFFKMFLQDANSVTSQSVGPNGAGVDPTSTATPQATDFSGWVPTPNWPVLLVKGELDPSIITGTIKYGGYNSSLYGQPVELAGKVWAQMQTKFDPYTGKSVVDCTKASNPSAVGCADAVGYFNETSDGHYEVEGVAPGVYTLYAEAAGYPQTPIATNVQVLKGQSLHFDGYLNPGPVIHGDVYSKHAFGSEPWPFYGDTGAYSGNGYCANLGNCYNAAGQFVGTNGPGREYIKIELYDKPTVNNVPSSNATVVSWSPLPCVAGGQTQYYPGDDANACGDPRTAGTISFPWDQWLSSSNNGVWGNAAGGVFTGTGQSTDPEGVGPAQNWYVVADGVNDKFHYEFGAKGMFGAPRDLDGHVPQRYATWVNGLTAGRYYVRAWVFRYVQTAIDGATFQEYSFQVTPNEWAGDISIPLDLRISSWVNKTVHFHDNAGTLVTSPIDTGASVLVGSLLDSRSGVLYSYNQTLLCGTTQYPCQYGNVYYGTNGVFNIFTGVSTALTRPHCYRCSKRISIT